MGQNATQKISLLALYEILQQNTDEETSMTTQEILAALKERGIEVSRKTLYEDIRTLNSYGYEIMCEKSRSNRYYIANRRFEKTEVQILMSAVGSEQFLTDKKTSVLMQKLCELLGVTEAEQVQSVISVRDDKSNNERIYYNIDAVTTALLEKKKLSFLYFNWDVNGKRTYRKDKYRYVVNPLGLVCSEEKLYLICFHDRYNDAANYRLDRMDEVQVEQKEITHKKEFENFDIAEYKKEQFGMFAGDKETVTLVFPKELIQIAADRFGQDIKTVSVGNSEYSITVTVQITKNFFAWLTAFEGRVKIESPSSVREQYEQFLKKITENL